MKNPKQNDAPLSPLLKNAAAFFRTKNHGEIASFLDLIAKAATLRRLNREEIEKISLIFAPKGPWESIAGAPELAQNLARLMTAT